MENNKDNRSIVDRLGDIEAQQRATQEQNAAILNMLGTMNKNTQATDNYAETKQAQEQAVKDFLKRSVKEHLWLGNAKEFSRDKTLSILATSALLVMGIITTIVTSVALGLYSTFTFVENVCLIFAGISLYYEIYAKRRMFDIDLMKHSTHIFKRDADGCWRDSGAEKKMFKWSRRLSYVAVVANIIFLVAYRPNVPVASVTLEIVFALLFYLAFYAHTNLFCGYSLMLLYTGENLVTKEKVTLCFDVARKKLGALSEFQKYIDA